MSQYLFGVTVNNGLVTAVKFQAIPASDLPLSGVVAGGYTAATIVVDQYGRITSASSNTVGAGTVTSVSVVTANGVSGSVATATTTPAITITLGAITPTSVAASGTVTGSNLSGTNTGDQTITLTGDVTGSGTGSFVTTIAANVVTYAKIQQVAASRLLGNPTGSLANVSEIGLGAGLSFSGTTLVGNTGTVTSVAMTVPSFLSVSGSPITVSGTLAVTLANQTANTIFAGPTSGGAAAPSFRAQVAADLPAFNTLTSGTVALADQVPIYNASATANRQDTIEDVLMLLGRGRIDGLVLSNDGTSPNTVIDIAAGVCVDSTNARIMKLAAFTKTTGAWAVGTGNGGLFSGTVGNSTWYHVFVIRKTSDGSIDAGIDTSVSAANIPAGYGSYRRIGSILTNGSAAIIAFTQRQDEFWWNTSVLDINATNPGTAAVTRTLTVPTGVNVAAILTPSFYSSTLNIQGYISDLATVDLAVSFANDIESGAGDTTIEGLGPNIRIWTNTSAQVRSRLSQSDGNTTIKIRTLGWVDPRGKNG